MELLIIGALGAIGMSLIAKETAPVLKPVPVKTKKN